MYMNVLNINTYFSYRVSSNLNSDNQKTFKAAKDISPEYVLNNHSKYLPKRMQDTIRDLLNSGQKELPPLWKIHEKVYELLMKSTSLEEAKNYYPELKDVQEMTILENNRSKNVKAVLKIMPLANFTLEYLKRIYALKNQQSIVEEFGFTQRSSLDWLNIKLNIQKLSGNYLNLVRMSKEEENNKVAECSRRAIYENPKAQTDRLQKAADAHRTPEYRQRKSKEMRNFYKEHPEYRERTSIISQRTWDRCPEIKTALSEFRARSSVYVKKVISKDDDGAKLTPNELRTVKGFYKRFWNTYPELLKIYQLRRVEVIEELRRENPSLFLT